MATKTILKDITLKEALPLVASGKMMLSSFSREKMNDFLQEILEQPIDLFYSMAFYQKNPLLSNLFQSKQIQQRINETGLSPYARLHEFQIYLRDSQDTSPQFFDGIQKRLSLLEQDDQSGRMSLARHEWIIELLRCLNDKSRLLPEQHQMLCQIIHSHLNKLIMDYGSAYKGHKPLYEDRLIDVLHGCEKRLPDDDYDAVLEPFFAELLRSIKDNPVRHDELDFFDFSNRIRKEVLSWHKPRSTPYVVQLFNHRCMHEKLAYQNPGTIQDGFIINQRIATYRIHARESTDHKKKDELVFNEFMSCFENLLQQLASSHEPLSHASFIAMTHEHCPPAIQERLVEKLIQQSDAKTFLDFLLRTCQMHVTMEHGCQWLDQWLSYQDARTMSEVQAQKIWLIVSRLSIGLQAHPVDESLKERLFARISTTQEQPNKKTEHHQLNEQYNQSAEQDVVFFPIILPESLLPQVPQNNVKTNHGANFLLPAFH